MLGIIAVMISILVPTLSRARASSKRTACAAQLRDIGNAFHLYLNDSRGRLPDKFNPLPLQPAEPGLPTLFDVFDPYLKTRKIWVCPADRIIDGDDSIVGFDSYADAYGVSYEYNFYLNALCPDRMFSKALEEAKQINITADRFRVLNDLSHFHGKKGGKGNMNFLFADWHVADFDGAGSAQAASPGTQR